MARILVAEDEPAEREVLATWLRARGHRVSAVADGMAALGALNAEPFDVVIADIVMPVVDGIALALKAAQDFPKVKVILVTGYGAELARAQNLEALVARVVPKPYRLRQMSDAVAEITGSAAS